LEHVYPQWVSRKVQVKGSILHSIGTRSIRTTKALDVKVKAVCQRCNSGWLSDLEAWFGTKMLPAIAGDPVQLDPHEQQQVAIWAAKTWLLAEKALRHDRGWAVEGDAILRFLLQARRPPREMTVWTGAVVPGHDTLAWVSTMLVNRPPVGAIGIFTLGNLAFHIYHAFPPIHHQLRIGNDMSEGWVQLWPEMTPTVAWPPPVRFDIDDMNRFWRTGPVEISVTPAKDRQPQ
jgi:hypothetical protein